MWLLWAQERTENIHKPLMMTKDCMLLYIWTGDNLQKGFDGHFKILCFVLFGSIVLIM